MNTHTDKEGTCTEWKANTIAHTFCSRTNHSLNQSSKKSVQAIANQNCNDRYLLDSLNLQKDRRAADNFVLLPAGGKRKIESEEQLIKLITGETDEPIKTPPSAAPVR